MWIKQCVLIGVVAAAVTAGSAGSATQMVVTVRPAKEAGGPASVGAGDLTVLLGNASAPIVSLERLVGDSADMQLFILLDDSTRSSSLGTQLRELKTFIESSPATTQIGIGYMRNGSFGLAQSFTADHQKAARALRLPVAIPGENGSPYFALSDLVEHWPSKESTGRRVVLMLTDGVDRYYGSATMDDPYEEAAIHNALKKGVMVYSIYLRGAGSYGLSGWVTNIAQSRLIEVSQQTGGYAFFQGLTDPVAISPFLSELQDYLANQYRVTIDVLGEKGFQSVKVRTELPGLKVSGPSHIYVH